ncbi:MAG: hypothetical protein WC788_06195 [Candidatus Paceibacterota bacterium]|jgi:putative flippase GtrA
MSDNDPERSKKAKKMVLFYLLFAVLVYLLGIVNAIVLMAILVIGPKIVRYINAKRGTPAGEGIAAKLNFGKIFKTLLFVALVAVILYFLISYLMSMDTSENKGPLNSVIYVESQEGAGIVNNNGTYGIQLATGGATTGTTFIIRTKETVTGWPAFGADVYSPKGGSTLKVSYIDADNLKNSIRFQEVSIPANYSFGYSNKYKLSDYRGWIKNGTSEEVVSKGNLPRKDPIRHDIELEVYVAPNSYVELSNMILRRNW